MVTDIFKDFPRYYSFSLLIFPSNIYSLEFCWLSRIYILSVLPSSTGFPEHYLFSQILLIFPSNIRSPEFCWLFRVLSVFPSDLIFPCVIYLSEFCWSSRALSILPSSIGFSELRLLSRVLLIFRVLSALPSATDSPEYDLFSNIINYPEYHRSFRRLLDLLKYSCPNANRAPECRRIINEYVFVNVAGSGLFDSWQRIRRLSQVEISYNDYPLMSL